jgi:5'-nucleotidase
MPTILITNDDGITAPGLLALKRGLAPLGRVVVLAPERNWSASSHIRTLYHPLRIQPQRLEDGSEAWSCSGSPADCVALAMAGALDGVHPDLVVAGINAGHNLGIDVAYSGTVACAREAVIKMAPGIAVSSIFPTQGDITDAHATAGRVARQIAAQVLERGLPPNTLLNVNVPGLAYGALKGTKADRAARSLWPSLLLAGGRRPYGPG